MSAYEYLRDLSDEHLRSLVKSKIAPEVDDAAFLGLVKERNAAGKEFGKRMGWWLDWGEHGPIPHPKVFMASDYVGKTMAHIMADAGYFASVGDARRNGWNKPAAAGTFHVGKDRPPIKVI